MNSPIYCTLLIDVTKDFGWSIDESKFLHQKNRRIFRNHTLRVTYGNEKKKQLSRTKISNKQLPEKRCKYWQV